MNLVVQDWYTALVDEVQSTLTEAVFASRWTLIEGYHTVGKLLREHDDKVSMTELVNKCAEDMGVSDRKLWYAVQFYDKFPDIQKLPGGKNVSWSKIKTEYLPESTTKKVEKPKPNVCKHCGELIICPSCGK